MKMPVGATPLTAEDMKGLIPKLKTRPELNEFEQANISDALIWANKSRKLRRELLTASGLFLLHKRMFSETWTWAGTQRIRVTNPGVDPGRILNDLGILLNEVHGWIEYRSFPLEEIAVRLHHRLVYIHLFPNGNGRHSRMVADLFLQYRKGPTLTWAKKELNTNSEARKQYIRALQTADVEQDYGPLMEFARSE